MAGNGPVAIVVCGPSGVGKTTIGTMLAATLGLPFYEGDSFHSAANVAKMHSGCPLTDADRAPWLQRLRAEVIEQNLCEKRQSVVLACSALKHAYRDVLRGTSPSSRVAQERTETNSANCTTASTQVFFVLLHGDADVIAKRMAARTGHYMPPTLLASQLATLEPLDLQHEHGTVEDLSSTPEEIVADAAARIHQQFVL